MLSIAKFGAKLAVVGSAVYVTVDNSVWDKGEYARNAITTVKESLPETTELLKELPTTSTLTNKWNQSVASAFGTVANNQVLKDSSNKLSSWISTTKSGEAKS